MGSCCCSSKKDKLKIQMLEIELARYQSKFKFRTSEETKSSMALELIHEGNKEKSDVIIKPGRLADFLQVDPRQHLYE